MFPCPRCGKPVPEVLGAEDQRCPHCAARIAPEADAPPAGRLLAEGFATLARRAPRWWAIFLLPALAVDAATWGLALASRDFADLLTGCGGAPVRGGAAVVGGVVALVGVSLLAYFVGWAAVAAEHGGVARDAGWWRRVLAGSALLAAVFTLGLVLLVLPAILFFAWFLFAPVALGRGAGPVEALDLGRAVGRHRPAGFTLLVLLVALGAEAAQLGASCLGGLAPSLAAQGLAWWLLAPVVPVLTTVAFARLAERAA